MNLHPLPSGNIRILISNYSWRCEKVSKHHISWDFLAYLQSHPHLETEITKRIILLEGIEFESTNYATATMGFNHLFRSRKCFPNCTYAHVTCRQIFLGTFRRKINV